MLLSVRTVNSTQTIQNYKTSTDFNLIHFDIKIGFDWEYKPVMLSLQLV
jgi:hypothetical protein